MDSRICQTSTASPAEPGGLLIWASVAADSEAAERSLLFLPGALPQRIEAADPMIQDRTAAYPVSFRRRNQ